ncbi:MAG: hypothetical protein V1726_00180 [Methanobacteriota archaeon]
MPSKKILASLGVLLALIILCNPLSVTTIHAADDVSVECMIVDDDGVTSTPVLLSQEEIDTFLEKISALSDQLNPDQSYLEILRTITDFSDTLDDHSMLDQNLFETIGDFHLGLLGKRVFILSYGHGVQLNPLRKFQINFLRPSYLLWFYPDITHNGIIRDALSDRTIIIDPSPFRVRVLDGRQIGMMRRFIGIYIFIPGQSPTDSTVLFIGYTFKVFGLDLSPTHS